MLYETCRTEQEAIQFVILVKLLDTVEESRDNIVSARSLAT